MVVVPIGFEHTKYAIKFGPIQILDVQNVSSHEIDIVVLQNTNCVLTHSQHRVSVVSRKPQRTRDAKRL